jgi:eukaryotic-like serine/threonine-protein kinase
MGTTDQRTLGGRYRLIRSIGQGGMGTVWEAHDDVLHRPVAVKEVRFPPELGRDEVADLRERTMREARATARLSHPNVVRTYDVVEEDGRPWIVMELLSTRTLAEVMRGAGPLPPHRVAEIGLGVLSALEAAHAEGVVHRDVKPSNVLITGDGRAVLTDFGIATTAGDPALTSTGVVLGSPAYLPPERARGRAFGPASDLWSLGATLFAAAEGRPPFDGDNPVGVLTSVISDPVPPLSAGGPLAEAVAGLMAKDPAERLDIATTRSLLQRASADRSGTATVPTVPSPPTYDRTRDDDIDEGPRRGLLAAGLVLAVLLIGGLVALALMQGGGDPGASGTTPKPDPSASSGPSSSPPASPTSTPPSDDGVPAGYQLYSDDSGFSLAVPEGWSAEQSSPTAVDITSPDGGSFLRIDQTDRPKDDPQADWEKQEKSVSKRLPEYQRVSIDSVDYRGWAAADWEFTFVDNGVPVHVRNRGFVTDDTHGYALYYSVPDSSWSSDQTQQVFQVAADTFQPATGEEGEGGGDQDERH